MRANPLGYDSARKALPPQMWSRLRRPVKPVVGAVAAAAVIVLVALLRIPVKSVEASIDSVSGSRRMQTVWIGGMTSGAAVTPSALDVGLRKAGVSWTPAWRCVRYERFNLLGDRIERGYDLTPPIDRSRWATDVVLASLSKQELSNFARFMQYATDAQQRVAIDAVLEKALEPSQRAAYAMVPTYGIAKREPIAPPPAAGPPTAKAFRQSKSNISIGITRRLRLANVTGERPPPRELINPSLLRERPPMD